MLRIGKYLSALLMAGISSVSLMSSASAQTSDASTLASIAKSGELRLGWTQNVPSSYRDPKTNEVVGYSIDMAKEMAKDLGVKLVLVEDSAATLAAGLQSNKFDLSIPLAITLPRLRAVTYSRPFMSTPVSLLMLSKNADKYKSWHDLDNANVTISTTLGSNIDLYVTTMFKKAKIDRVRNQSDSLSAVMAGRADAWANSVESLEPVTKQRTDVVIIKNGQFASAELAFPMRQGDFIFAAWINQFLREKAINGQLRDLLNTYGLNMDNVLTP